MKDPTSVMLQALGAPDTQKNRALLCKWTEWFLDANDARHRKDDDIELLTKKEVADMTRHSLDWVERHRDLFGCRKEGPSKQSTVRFDARKVREWMAGQN